MNDHDYPVDVRLVSKLSAFVPLLFNPRRCHLEVRLVAAGVTRLKLKKPPFAYVAYFAVALYALTLTESRKNAPFFAFTCLDSS